MRIYLSCLQSVQKHNIPGYSFWEKYFKMGIEEAGHEWVEAPGIDWAECLALQSTEAINEWSSRTWSKVVDFIKRENSERGIDIFIGYLYPRMIDSSAIREIQRLGVPCVNFFCDNVREFYRIPSEYFGFDLHWVPEYEALAMYQQCRLKTVHAPMPCWIPHEMRTIAAAETEPITFIGSIDPLRHNLLAKALLRGADFIVRGPGWSAGNDSAITQPTRQDSRTVRAILSNQYAMVLQHGWSSLYYKVANKIFSLDSSTFPNDRVKPAVFGEEYFRISREAMVTIGVNRVPTARASLRRPLTYSRLRDIEAPMLGACYLTEWSEGLPYLYDLDREICAFRTVDELCTQIRELEDNPQKRRNLRVAGQVRALSDHSVMNSLEKIRKAILN